MGRELNYVIEANAAVNVRAGGQLFFLDNRFGVTFTKSRSCDKCAAQALAKRLPSKNPVLCDLARAFLHAHSARDSSKELIGYRQKACCI